MHSKMVQRRLLLAKAFYLQARENSKRVDSVSKMMAVHNYHISVEITLKTIILEFNVRPEKQLNIDFESMMSEITKRLDKPFPYRQELRSLNSFRGLIQHQGIEPDQSTLEDFDALTKGFLTEIFRSHFEVDFRELSKAGLIHDEKIKTLLGAAFSYLSEGQRCPTGQAKVTMNCPA